MADSQELDLELALDRIEAQLEGDLRAHVEAFATAHATGAPPPPAPDVVGRASTAALGRRALAFEPLRHRALALLRVVAPVVMERDAAVAAARAAEPTWTAWRALAAARDAVARARFGRGYVEVIHRLAGVADVDVDPTATLPPPLPAWTASDRTIGDAEIAALWSWLRAVGPRVSDGLTIVSSRSARPRCFLVARGARAVAVVPQLLDSPAARFAVLHELGHAAWGLSTTRAGRHDDPRSIEEAAAAVIAGRMEHLAATPDGLPEGWYSAVAVTARHRRLAIARVLDAIERGAAAPPADLARPPWALWHDPGAQAAYVHAEQLAVQATQAPVSGASTIVGAFAALDQAARQIDARVTL